MQLAVNKLHRLVLIKAGTNIGRLSLEHGTHPLPPTDELQVALIREHDRLGSAASTDHNRLSVGACLPEAFKHRRKLSTGFPSGQDFVGVLGHPPSLAHVYT